MYESGNDEARPNLHPYVNLIDSYVKSGGPDAAEKAEALLFEMSNQYKEGNVSVKPNAQLASSVVACWSKSGIPDAGKRAEAVLDWLVDTYEKDGDEALRPSKFIFTNGKYTWHNVEAPVLQLNRSSFSCDGLGQVTNVWQSSGGTRHFGQDERTA